MAKAKKRATCARCNESITQPQTGRPRRFCPTCGPLAVLRRKRIDTRLDAIEGELRHWRLVNANPGSLAAVTGDNYGRNPEQAVDDLEREKFDLETELLTLL